MQKQYPEAIRAISLNVDHDTEGAPSEELRKEVRDKLVDLDMQIINVFSETAHDEVLEKYDLFSLPAALVFGKDGTLLKTFDGGFSYEDDIVPILEKTLNGS